MSNQKSKPTGKTQTPYVLECKNVNIKNLSFTEFDNKSKNVKQQTCYPKYEYAPNEKNSFIFRTDDIKFVQGGIPPMNEKTADWCKSDADRGFFTVPCDPGQPQCVTLFNLLDKLDEIGREEMKRKYGKDVGKYEYSPIVKDGKEYKGKDGQKKQSFRSCKVKFDLEYSENPNEKRNIDTTVFLRENGKPVQRHVKTVTDIAEIFTYNCRARFVIMVTKFWAQKKPVNGKMGCGISLKCLQLEVTEQNSHGSVKEAFKNQCAFPDNEEPVTFKLKDSGNDSDAPTATTGTGTGTGTGTATAPAPPAQAKDAKDVKETKESAKDKKDAKSDKSEKGDAKADGKSDKSEKMEKTEKGGAKADGKSDKTDKTDKSDAKGDSKGKKTDNKKSKQETVEEEEGEDGDEGEEIEVDVEDDSPKNKTRKSGRVSSPKSKKN